MKKDRNMSEDSLKVSELNNWIKDVLNGNFPDTVWVCGEIQGYNRNRSKSHIFFELVEKDPDAKKIIARIGLVIFANRKFVIENVLNRSENAFALKDDIEVRFACKVDFYAPHGAVRLIVESIDPTYTLGKLAQEKQKLIAELKKKGILDKNKQLKLSTVPLRIGLITSDDSAAHNDFYSELKRSGFGFKIYLRNTLMQGAKAEKDICKALNELEKVKNLDAIIITRGGGSIADLACFDSQLIAEHIAASSFPVLSGIGHEINMGITDMAAHTYAKTPTAIAQFLVNQVEEFLTDIEENITRVIEGAQERIYEEKQQLKNTALSLQSETGRFLKEHNEKVIRVAEFMKSRPAILLRDYQRRLIIEKEQLSQKIKFCIEHEKIKVTNYQKIIDIVHPVNTMKRGFSITRTSQGKILKSIQNVEEKEEILTEIVDGIFKSIVEKGA